MSEVQAISKPKSFTPLSMDPHKFALWLFMVSITMLFGAFTSAYIVKQSGGDWLVFDLPDIFLYSTVLLLVSSLTLQWAYFAAKKDNLGQVKFFVLLTFLIGLVFVYMQYAGWQQLVAQDVFFVGNPAGSFVYVFSGMHAIHLFSGMIFLLVLVFLTLRYKIHSKNMKWMDMGVTYWHFLDGLWLYLYLFLVFNN